MGFFNDLGKKTSETTNKIRKEAKLKMKISDNKSKITSIYTQIGKKVYDNYKNGEEISKNILEEECKNLDELIKECEEARVEILRLNKKRICANCNTEITIESQFCSKCGTKQEPVEEIKEEAKAEKDKDSEKKEETKEEVKEEIDTVIENIEEKIKKGN